MMGEELNATQVTKAGLFGDRAYALVNQSDGKVASAKNPGKWPHLFDFRAVLADKADPGRTVPPVRVTFPHGTSLTSGQPDCDQLLSKVFNREVTLSVAAAHVGQEAAGSGGIVRAATAEEYWPDIEGLEYRDTVTEFGLPEGTFFDCASVHLLTTATMDRLRELYPEGRFEARRFRPNVIVQTPNARKDFVENGWIDKTLVIGEGVRLRVTGPCPRCVMTTLSQSDLPKDTGILRAAAQHNRANVGVYASVLQGGHIRRGDSVRLE